MSVYKITGPLVSSVNGKNVIFFLIFAQNIDCGYTLELTSRGGSKEYSQSMFWSKNKKQFIPLHTQLWGSSGYRLHGQCFPDEVFTFEHRQSWLCH